MRERRGNPFREAHGRPMRVYDWFAPAGTRPGDIPAVIEAAVPGLKLFHRGDNEVNGFINTSLGPDGSLYVSVQLYDTACVDPSCPGGHGPVKLMIAPALSPADITRMVNAVGEHPTRKLTRGNARAMLEALGFTLGDGPLRDD